MKRGLITLTGLLLLGLALAHGESTRSYGTVDSFGLLRWERFSANPAVGTLVALLAKPNPDRADLRTADAAVARKPDDLPSRALRAELRLRVDPAWNLPAPTVAGLARTKKPDRFEASYLYYHKRRNEHPDRYGITTDRDKASPPYLLPQQHDLVTIEMSIGLGEVSWSESLLLIDWTARYGFEDGRKELQKAVLAQPRIWGLEALRVPLLRCGGYTLTGSYPGVPSERLKQFPAALRLAQRLRKEHPECRVLDQMAGVAAMDLKKYDLARAYFGAYLAKPDPGIQGERRSRDVRELLAKLPK